MVGRAVRRVHNPVPGGNKAMARSGVAVATSGKANKRRDESMFERMPLMGDIREEIDSVGKVMAAVRWDRIPCVEPESYKALFMVAIYMSSRTPSASLVYKYINQGKDKQLE